MVRSTVDFPAPFGPTIQVTDPSVYADVPRVKALQDELAAIAARAETLMSQWEELTLRLEELEAARG